MDKYKALGLSSWNSSHKNRPLKANNERKTKVLTALISPIPDCHKEPALLDNDLRSPTKYRIMKTKITDEICQKKLCTRQFK